PGSTSTVRIQWSHDTARDLTHVALRLQPGDEEPGGPVHVRQREEELGPLGVAELRPLGSELLRLEARRVDDGLVLVGVDRANLGDDDAARPDALRRGSQERELELRKRSCAPAQVGAAGEDTETRAGRVDERAVEARELRREGERVGLYDPHFVRTEPADVLLELARAALVQLDRDDLPLEHRRLAARRRAAVERPLAGPGADDEAGELRCPALRPDP